MKNIYSKLLFVICTIFLVSCNNDETMSHTNVSAVNALYAPADNKFIDLNAPQGSAVFEWESAKAEDNGAVFYDVIFDREDGDFSNPVYVKASDSKGFQPALNITFTELNKIAEMAGIESGEIGKLKWTVYSTKGLNIQKSAVSRLIEVQRPVGFSAPDQLFITGTASETGEVVADAQAFKKIGDKFEIYTKLKAGTYKFITGKGSNSEVFYISDGKLKKDAETTYTGDSKVYKIEIVFSTAGIVMTEITKIELWFPPMGQYLFEYTYSGKGVWKADNKHIEFKQEGWGRDERYKFKFTVLKGTASSEEWYGSVNRDNNRPDANSPASYWEMVLVTDNYWDNCFKFASEVDNKNVNAEINFSAAVPAYTHSFKVL